MNPLISLVIPVYNVEKYLDKCMSSVLAQTYDNFEVILVDDGSTDNSGKMCDEYAEKYGRVTVYHKPNGGLSDARNFGVEHCNADLVSFIDSDDYVTEDYLEYLWYLMKKYNVDIACATAKRIIETAKINRDDNDSEILLDCSEAIKRICYTSCSACTRLYKRQFLLTHPYPKGRLYEDLATTCKIYGSSSKSVFGGKTIYYWVQRQGGITHSEIDKKQYDLFWSADEQLNYISENFPASESASHARCVMAACHFVTRLFSSKSKNRKQHFKYARSYVKKHLKYIVRDRNTPKNIIISGLTIYMGYTASKILWPVRQKIRKAIRGI